MNLQQHLVAWFIWLCGMLSPIFMSSQNDPWLGLEPVTYHESGTLAGMTTYRLYLHTPNETDFLVSCSGDDENPLILSSTSEPAWFQHESPTAAFATDINPIFFAAFPELAFDSWLTIGAEDNTAAVDIISLDDPSFAAFTAFEAGESIEITGTIGSAWFVLPIPTNVEAFAGSDLKILVAQLTTAGVISGQINIQVFLEGSEENEFREVLPILPSEACEFDEDNDGLCDELDPCIGQIDECGVCNGVGIAAGECDCEGNVLDECGVCGGDGLTEGTCDCNGNIVDAVGVCGGDCMADFNLNGVCDDNEVWGCLYPNACNFNPLATIGDCSCYWPGWPCDDGNANTFGDVYNQNCTCVSGGDILGCTYEAASNFNPIATTDDGSCAFAITNPCGLEYDGNVDGFVGSADLINLLTEFGLECE